MSRLIRRTLTIAVLAALAATAGVAAYIASPAQQALELVPPLSSARLDEPNGPYSLDYESLRAGFKPQRFRSYCGPASISTVLGAFGTKAEQTSIFPSASRRVDVFFSGMSLAELEQLAIYQGLKTERVHADTLSLEQFRQRVKQNMASSGDYVLINYDRRVLRQKGAGHISPIAAYDEKGDRLLVLDEAAYRYPFTWIPVSLLYDAMHTQAGEGWRGLLFITGRDTSP